MDVIFTSHTTTSPYNQLYYSNVLEARCVIRKIFSRGYIKFLGPSVIQCFRSLYGHCEYLVLDWLHHMLQRISRLYGQVNVPFSFRVWRGADGFAGQQSPQLDHICYAEGNGCILTRLNHFSCEDSSSDKISSSKSRKRSTLNYVCAHFVKSIGLLSARGMSRHCSILFRCPQLGKILRINSSRNN